MGREEDEQGREREGKERKGRRREERADHGGGQLLSGDGAGWW